MALDAMLKSMEKYGFLPEYHVVIRWSGKPFDSDAIIVDGQHRFDTAKEMGQPVYFMVATQDDIDLLDLVAAQREWRTFDYVNRNAAKGSPDYLLLLKFMHDHKIPLRIASILLGSCGGNDHHRDGCNLRDGHFRIRALKHAEKVVTTAEAIEAIIRRPFPRSSASLMAINRFMAVPGFKVDQLIKRVRMNPALVVKCSDLDSYSKMYDAVYNRGSREQIPLDFNARTLAQERCKQARWGARGYPQQHPVSEVVSYNSGQ
jgi:hypothetical protein